MLMMLAWLGAWGMACPADAHDARLAWRLGERLIRPMHMMLVMLAWLGALGNNHSSRCS